MVKRQYLFKVETIGISYLKEVTSVALFKRKLKQHILDNY